MLYSIPDTQPPALHSCEVTEDAVFFYLEDRVDRVARKGLNAEVLIQTYGPMDAADRLAQSHGERTYAWIRWQVLPLFGSVFAVGFTAAVMSTPLIGLIWTAFMGAIQWVIHECAYESIYRSEDPILFQNLDQGLLNLRRIEALDIQELDKITLTHRLGRIQSLVNSALVARRTDPTVSEKIIAGIIHAFFRDDEYYSY